MKLYVLRMAIAVEGGAAMSQEKLETWFRDALKGVPAVQVVEVQSVQPAKVVATDVVEEGF